MLKLAGQARFPSALNWHSHLNNNALDPPSCRTSDVETSLYCIVHSLNMYPTPWGIIGGQGPKYVPHSLGYHWGPGAEICTPLPGVLLPLYWGPGAEICTPLTGVLLGARGRYMDPLTGLLLGARGRNIYPTHWGIIGGQCNDWQASSCIKPRFASTSLPSNTNAPIWSMSIEIHGKFLLGRLLLSYSQASKSAQAMVSMHVRNSIAIRMPDLWPRYYDSQGLKYWHHPWGCCIVGGQVR